MSLTPVEPWDEENLPAVRSTADRWQDWIGVFRDIYKAAQIIAQTPLVPAPMIGKPEQVAAAMMKGYELGLDPLDALGQIYVVHGRVAFYADFMRRRIVQAGHKFRIVESTDNRCIVEGTRREGGEPQRAGFTAEQARRAGLDLGKYPADKLVARATSRLCKQVFPDVLSGTLIAEDIIDGLIPAGDDGSSEQPLEPAQAGTALTRKRRPKQAAAASTKPPAEPEKPADDTDDLLDETPAKPDSDGVASEPITAPPEPLLDDENDVVNPWAPVEVSPDQIPLLDEPAAPQPITPAQLTKLAILLREQFDEDREAKHDYCAAVIGHPITSAKDLTLGEVREIIDTLEN